LDDLPNTDLVMNQAMYACLSPNLAFSSIDRRVESSGNPCREAVHG
jgi:hypothetical protein